MWLQGRKFRTLSEKPKNAIKIKIGCVVIKLQVLKLNPDHLDQAKFWESSDHNWYFFRSIKSCFVCFLSSQMHPKAGTHYLHVFCGRMHGIIVTNMVKIVKIWFFLQKWSRAKMRKIFKIGKHIDGGVNDTCLQGRIFKTFSEKPKNAIKIKIGCVVTE